MTKIPRTHRGPDQGNLVALEGVLAALIMLSAVYAVTILRDDAVNPGSNARTGMAMAARDALVVLSGLSEDRGDLLSVYLAETFECAQGANPSATLCEGGRPSNFTHRLESYLAAGTAYRISIENGLEPRALYATWEPGGERVSAERLFAPDWNVTFVTTDISCHDVKLSVNVTAVSIWHGEPADVQSMNVEWSGGSVAGVASPQPHLWNATLPAAAIGSDLHARVVATEGPMAGTAGSALCDLAPRSWDLRRGLNMSHVSAPSVAPIGREAVLTYDFSAIKTKVSDAKIMAVKAIIYEPVPGRPEVAGAFVVAGTVDLPTAWTGTSSWRVPADSLFGMHPVVFVASLDIPTAAGKALIDVRLVTTTQVALPSGIVPIETPYRAVLEAWLPDWR